MPRKTKIIIIESFEELLRKKKYENITVKQIVDYCDINRKTFYYYFRDIDDLLEQAFDYELKMFLKTVPKGTSIYEGVETFFNFVSDNRDIIYHVANSSDIDSIELHFHRTIYRYFYKGLEGYTEGRNITDSQVDILSSVCAHSATGFIVQWLNDDMKGNPVTLVDEVHNMIDGVVEVVLKNCEKINESRN